MHRVHRRIDLCGSDQIFRTKLHAVHTKNLSLLRHLNDQRHEYKSTQPIAKTHENFWENESLNKSSSIDGAVAQLTNSHQT